MDQPLANVGVGRFEPFQPAVSSQRVAEELLKVLGIPMQRCRKVSITLEAGCAVLVQTEHWAAAPEGGELASIFKEYRLVEKES